MSGVCVRAELVLSRQEVAREVQRSVVVLPTQRDRGGRGQHPRQQGQLKVTRQSHLLKGAHHLTIMHRKVQSESDPSYVH